MRPGSNKQITNPTNVDVRATLVVVPFVFHYLTQVKHE